LATEVTIPQRALVEFASEILAQGGAFSFKAHGSSMSPFIRHGALVTVERAEFESLRPGDVVLYKTVTSAAIHRIVDKRMRNGRYEFVVRADRFPHVDEIVRADDVLGRIAAVGSDKRVFCLNHGFFRFAGRLLAKSIVLSYLVSRSYLLLSRVRRRALGMIR
jgi:signal peptidase I